MITQKNTKQNTRCAMHDSTVEIIVQSYLYNVFRLLYIL